MIKLLMATNFDQYPHQNDTPNAEADAPQTTPVDYVFERYEQPSSSAPSIVVDPSKLSRIAERLDVLDPELSDLQMNQSIVNASAMAVRNRPQVAREPAREKIPSTYEPTMFAHDSNAAYAPVLLATAWLELYYRQLETGDYPPIKEVSSGGSSRQLQRLVPRQLTANLPNGTIAETAELFLSPDLYKRYVDCDLISSAPGGQDGVPKIFWFTEDGEGYKAGTNADHIFRTDDMHPLSMANLRGTNNSVMLALRKIPSLMTTDQQDLKDALDAKAAEDARIQATRYQWRSHSGYSW